MYVHHVDINIYRISGKFVILTDSLANFCSITSLSILFQEGVLEVSLTILD